ncbi:MAG: type I 3-dehydroquinate dehydratase [Planctomycetales bacterium]|nr:type I 3-dehydroquinate dehydratase [Planctomycetales bacterium]
MSRPPLLVASLAAPDLAAAARDAETAVREGADLVEWRADLLPDPDPRRIRERVPPGVPALYTIRSRGQGGAFAGSPAEAARLREAAAASGFAWVDVEAPLEGEVPPLPAGVRTVLSFHDTSGIPRAAAALYDRLRARGPDIVKIVGTAREPADAAPLLDILPGSGDLAAFCQGEGGAASRVLAARAGGALVFGSAAADRPAAAGQIPVADLERLYRVGALTMATAVYGVAGDPVSHSRGPEIHNRVFAALGVDAVYLRFPTRDLAGLVAFLRPRGLAGLSVTLPHKEAAAALAAEVGASARAGSANTLAFRGGRILAESTDGEAARATLEEVLSGRAGGPGGLAGLRVLVLGAGGTARAVAAAMRDAAARVTVSGRTAARAEALSRGLGVAAAPWEARESVPAEVLVNATPLGMRAGDPLPADPSRFPGLLAALDAVYAPPETEFLRAVRAAGARAATGVRMFLHQAAAQLRIWLGRDVPLAVVGRAWEEAVS